MAFPETELEMARRHVREGDWHVKRQKAIVTRLDGTDGNADLARDILDTLEQSLAFHYTRLAQLERQDRSGSWWR